MEQCQHFVAGRTAPWRRFFLLFLLLAATILLLPAQVNDYFLKSDDPSASSSKGIQKNNSVLFRTENDCEADAGTFGISKVCIQNGATTVQAVPAGDAVVPEGYRVLYVLTSGEDLVIRQVNSQPSFDIDADGLYTIHTLVYDPATLDLSIVEIGATTGFDVNGLLVQGGGAICGSLDVVGVKFEIGDCSPVCTADAGTLSPTGEVCLDNGAATISAEIDQLPLIPAGYELIYVLTSGEELVIQGVNAEPVFDLNAPGRFTIHTLVYDPATLDLSIVEIGVTTGVDVNALLIQGGGEICAALDVDGAAFDVAICPCDALAGALTAEETCFDFDAGTATLTASIAEEPTVPEGFEVIYVLTSGEELVIQGVNAEPSFEVSATGRYTIHTLVYNPATLDLSVVEIGVTTGVDVNSLLVQGGGFICAALDVAGAVFELEDCPCEADAGTLMAQEACFDFDAGTATLTATTGDEPTVPEGYEVLYVLTSGEELVIQGVNAEPSFEVDAAGRYTIHTLVYNPATLDLSIVEIGVTTGVDVNGLLIQGGGEICASLDVVGAIFELEDCPCEADAGTLTAEETCFDFDAGTATLTATIGDEPTVPEGYEVLYVLTSGEELEIRDVGAEPSFEVDAAGRYTIHTLVYNPATLDLSIVEIGVTTGVDVNGLLIQGGGEICASLDVAGAVFELEDCPCEADAGTLTAEEACFDFDVGTATLTATTGDEPTVPEGYEVLYVLTSGEELVIRDVGAEPSFEVDAAGRYTIHTLVYNPATLDLSIVEIGVTTGVDVNGLLIQGGGEICASLDVVGAIFELEACEEEEECLADAGALKPDPESCFTGGSAILTASVATPPTVPAGFEVVYVLTTGEELIIQDVNLEPDFEVTELGRYTIHTLVYDPATLDLSVVELGVTTGFDVNSLLIQGGGEICASLDVAGAVFEVENCPTPSVCLVEAGRLRPAGDEAKVCLEDGTATLTANQRRFPHVQPGYQLLFVLTSGQNLVIRQVSERSTFQVTAAGIYRIHTLVYDPNTLDLSVVVPGVTTGFDVNRLLIQGGGDICGALDVEGAYFEVINCPPPCKADAGCLYPRYNACLAGGKARLDARFSQHPHIPRGYSLLYVLTSGEDLVIQGVSRHPVFTVNETGRYAIHSLVYDPSTLDLGIVQIGKTTGFDVNSLLIQGGGTICGALDVKGAVFNVKPCWKGPFGFQAFPNPFSDVVTVEAPEGLEASAAAVFLEIVNSNGELVSRREFPLGAYRETLDLSNLAPGMYNVRIISEGEVLDNLRVTKGR